LIYCISGIFLRKLINREYAVAETHIQEHVWSPYAAFDDRRDAGRCLVEFLNRGSQEDVMVLALPRGGVPVGEPLAEALNAGLDLALVRKLPIPYSREMGFGAVAIDGSRILNHRIVRHYGISKSEIESISEEVREEVRRRAREYRGHDTPPLVADKDVYLVDDGLATGYSMIAAAKMVRNLGPKSMILAVPASPLGSLDAVEQYFDEIFCLIAQDKPPFAVASFYRDFHDMPDDEVRAILRRRNAGVTQEETRPLVSLE
jgi:putative phosphoribosyl transferase